MELITLEEQIKKNEEYYKELERLVLLWKEKAQVCNMKVK